jgi:protein-S-isoprenylcysteine O-methyltransferase Ste14
MFGAGLGYIWPVQLMSQIWGHIIGIVLVVVSVPIMPPVLIRFKREKTTFDVRKNSTTLIIDGPYKYSRNPTYISLTLFYLGLGIFFNNVWVLVFVFPILLIMNFWVVQSEERHLEEVFSDEYLLYKSQVRRWL